MPCVAYPLQFKAAVMEVLELSNSEYVKVETTVTVCTVDNWQRRVSVFNEADGDRSAADVASGQVSLASFASRYYSLNFDLTWLSVFS